MIQGRLKNNFNCLVRLTIKKKFSHHNMIPTLAQQYMVKMAPMTGMIPISFQRLLWTMKRRMQMMKRKIKTNKWKSSQCIRNHLPKMKIVTIRKEDAKLTFFSTKHQR